MRQGKSGGGGGKEEGSPFDDQSVFLRKQWLTFESSRRSLFVESFKFHSSCRANFAWDVPFVGSCLWERRGGGGRGMRGEGGRGTEGRALGGSRNETTGG